MYHQDSFPNKYEGGAFPRCFKTFFEELHKGYTTEYYTETVQDPVYVQVPRYATKYYYTIWRWSPGRDVTSSGENHETAWPEYTLEENEREGKRSEAYSFTVTNSKGETAEYRLAEKDWMNLNPGDSIFITAKRTGADPYISDEKGNKIADLVREK